jgi:antitoxin MazE
VPAFRRDSTFRGGNRFDNALAVWNRIYYVYSQWHQEAGVAVTLQKWGNSVGVRLPKPMLEQVGLKEGAQVDVLVEGNHLVIRRKRLKLADLLAQCKPENRPDPIDWGPPVGREII